jgi:hypothetical protein
MASTKRADTGHPSLAEWKQSGHIRFGMLDKSVDVDRFMALPHKRQRAAPFTNLKRVLNR